MQREVTTELGQVRGRPIDGGWLFAGVPFAAPASGDRRFSRPGPGIPWSGVRECVEPSPCCPQPAVPMPAHWAKTAELPAAMDENCLALNILTPSTGVGSRPVMVWIHGGGFQTGSGSSWPFVNGGFLRDDVVLVTINYRLNVFGSLYLDEHCEHVVGSGTNGLADQIAALEWVRRNVSAFGGDPRNVTVFGQSAGAWSVAALLGSPAARGLFRKAIVQSGGAESVVDRSFAAHTTSAVLMSLGLTSADLHALRSLPASRLVAEAMPGVHAGPPRGWPTFCPVIGDPILPQPPLAAIRDGNARNVDVVLGTNRDEWRAVRGAYPPDALPAPDFADALDGTDRTADDVVSWYRERGHPTSPDIAAAFETDWLFTLPTIRLAEALIAGGSRVWRYRLDWPTPAANGALGACHGLDLPFVFGADDVDLHGPNPPRSLTSDVHGAWVRFATEHEPRQAGPNPWPRYRLDERAVALFDVPTRVRVDPDADVRAFWDHQIIGGTGR